MKLEKLSDDKIQVIFSIQELEKENVNYHSFMSNSIENNSIFNNLLYQAKKELDFNTDNYKLTVETIELSDGHFVLTITRSFKKNKKVILHRKSPNLKNNMFMYKFDNIDDFYDFCEFLKSNPHDFFNKLQNKNSLYHINREYFLIFYNLTLNNDELCYLSSCISEFAYFSSDSSVTINKVIQNSHCICEKNAVLDVSCNM